MALSTFIWTNMFIFIVTSKIDFISCNSESESEELLEITDVSNTRNANEAKTQRVLKLWNCSDTASHATCHAQFHKTFQASHVSDLNFRSMCFEAPAFILFTGQYETNLFISCFMQIQYIAKIAAIFGTYIYNRAEMLLVQMAYL